MVLDSSLLLRFFPLRSLATIAITALFAACASQPPARDVVTGTATYRERVALPPDAVFSATLLDASRADAPAREIAGVRQAAGTQLPIRFAIDFQPGLVTPRGRYNVRAEIRAQGRLLFSTDINHAVLGATGVRNVDILLRRAGDPVATTPKRLRGLYTFLADSGSFVDCDGGARLAVAAEGASVALESAYFDARARAGAPVYAVIDGRVVQRPTAEAGGAARPVLMVDKLVEVSPAAVCPPATGTGQVASLENTYWKLLSVRGTPVALANGGAAGSGTAASREPHVTLQPAERRAVGSTGCNRFAGGYILQGDRLSFTGTAGTKMACAVPALAQQEKALLDALRVAVGWRIKGPRLELLDAGNRAVAEFESRVMR